MITSKKVKLAKAASNRVWGIIVLHALCAPLGSAVYSAKQGNWLPFGLSTVVAVVGLPFALFDLGLTSFVIAPGLSVWLLVDKTMSSRRQLGVCCPEEAEMVLWKAIEKRAAEIEG